MGPYFENKWKEENGVPQQESWWNYYGGNSISAIGENIAENVQLNVTNLHIRYEDDTTVPGHTFACGIKISHLSALVRFLQYIFGLFFILFSSLGIDFQDAVSFQIKSLSLPVNNFDYNSQGKLYAKNIFPINLKLNIVKLGG